jgi:replicative DNA helicase
MNEPAGPIPPHSLEAEQAVLGGILLDPELLAEVGPILKPEHFYALIHERIFATVLGLQSVGAPLDSISIAEELRKRSQLDSCGGFSYLAGLASGIQTASSIAYFARLVREKATLRALVRAGNAIAQIGYQGEDDAEGALEQADDTLRRLVLDGAPARDRSRPEIQARYDSMIYGTGSKTYTTPWPQLDAYTGGFSGGEIVVWGGDEGIGKSILVNMLAAWTAEKFGHVALFPTEMGETRTFARLLALFSGVSVRRQRQQNYAFRDEQAIEKARAKVAELPITLFDADPAFSSADIYQQCIRLHARSPLHGIFIDTVHFLTDIDASGHVDARDRSTHERQKRAISTLRRLALKLDVPLHLVFHMSRPDPREKKPKPSRKRLRDGGNIEGTATCVIFPYEADGVYSLLVDKAREGNGDKEVPMAFHGNRAVWLQAGSHAQNEPWFEPQTTTESLFERQETYAG